MKKILVVFLVLMFVAGCADPETVFQEAEQRRSIEAYQQLIAEYPDSSYAQIAQERIAEIQVWESAYGKKDEAIYIGYLMRYPEGLYSKEAKMQMEAIGAYRPVRDEDTQAGYRKYNEKYPEGVFAEEVAKRLKELEPVEAEYQAILQETDPSIIHAFIEQYSSTGYTKLAQKRLLEVLPQPNIEFVFDKSVLENWSEELLADLRQLITEAVQLASLRIPIESNTVYARYSNSFGIGFDGNGRPYNFFSHELKIEVIEVDDVELYKKRYKGQVADAHQGRVWSSDKTAGITRGPVDYKLVLENVEKWLREDPL